MCVQQMHQWGHVALSRLSHPSFISLVVEKQPGSHDTLKGTCSTHMNML